MKIEICITIGHSIAKKWLLKVSNNTNSDLEVTVSHCCANRPLAITVILSHVCCSVTPVDINALLFVNCFNDTFALYCLMRRVIVPLNQYDDDDDDDELLKWNCFVPG